MKGYLFLAVMICSFPLLASAQSDVYYIPTKKVKTITRTDSNGEEVYTYSAKAVKESNATAKYYSDNRDVDEYNRRGGSSASGVASNQESLTDEDETYVADDPQAIEDYKYSKHIIRFYSPRRGIMISSPYYWDICYNDVWDVYYDGWAYGLPSYAYWTYAYDPWYYNHWWYRSCWDFTWGWHSPWYSYSYWGWGRPIYWGWSRPVYYHHSHYRYGRPMWSHGGYHRYAPGFGRYGGRAYSGRGFDAPRVDRFGSRSGGRMGVGAPRTGSRPLSGVFRSNRQPAMARNGGMNLRSNGQMSRGTRQTGPNSVMRADGPVVRNGGGGVVRGGHNPQNIGQQRQVQQRSNNTRNSAPSTYNRGETRRSTP